MSQPIDNKSISNLPWEDKPSDCKDIIWRYSANPIIGRSQIENSMAIHNSAPIPFGDGFAGVFRVDTRERKLELHSGFSKDGLKWELQEEPISFVAEYEESAGGGNKYDPRVCIIDDEYYVTWCNAYHGPTIGIAKTEDFKTYHQMDNAFLPFNRNGVLFPRKINGKYAMLSRPSDNGHTPFGDIFYSVSPDMEHWGHHRHVMAAGAQNWERLKIGPGPVPIETEKGWLMLYHGVFRSCNGYVYSMGGALLDLEDPSKVLYKSRRYLMTPEMPYEMMGVVPNVVFPCAALCDEATGRMAIYYGGADTCINVAFTYIDDIVDYIITHAE